MMKLIGIAVSPGECAIVSRQTSARNQPAVTRGRHLRKPPLSSEVFCGGRSEIIDEEVESWKWMKIEDVKTDMLNNPNVYTVWFKIIFDEFYHYLEDHKL